MSLDAPGQSNTDQSNTGQYSATCPFEIRRPIMMHRWDLLTFLHWPYPAKVVQALLPAGLTVETYDVGDGRGPRAWVGLVPFMIEVRPPKLPAVPGISHFCETNVRTYVTAPDGTTGVWFLSLDADQVAGGGGRPSRLPPALLLVEDDVRTGRR